MKQVLVQYAQYNFWANKQLLAIALKLNEQQQKEHIASSFSSVQATIVHLLDAESIWWQRLQLQEIVIAPSTTKTFTTPEAVQTLLAQSESWVKWVTAAKEVQLDHVFAYQNSKKEQFKQPVWQMLLHLFNHGTYHRGQLVTLYNQLGVTKIPATDFIHWSRTNK